ncbi:MAG: flagellar hook-length control protein FliK [Vicinamibacterales bacterium]
MASVEFIAAPLEAAVASTSVGDGRPDDGSGFATALAAAQAADAAPLETGPNDPSGGEGGCACPTGRGFALLPTGTWLTLTGFAPSSALSSGPGPADGEVRSEASASAETITEMDPDSLAENTATLTMLAPVLVQIQTPWRPPLPPPTETAPPAADTAPPLAQTTPQSADNATIATTGTAVPSMALADGLTDTSGTAEPAPAMAPPATNHQVSPSRAEEPSRETEALDVMPANATNEREAALTRTGPGRDGTPDVPSGQDSSNAQSIAPSDRRARPSVPHAQLTRSLAAQLRAEEQTARPEAGPTRRVPDAEEGRPTARFAPSRGPEAFPAPIAAPIPLTVASSTRSFTVEAPAMPQAMAADTGEGLPSQIVQAMRLQWHGSGGDARIRLQPHYLGELTISLKVEQGAVIAYLAASQSDVRQWIESNESLLRHTLAQHDLRLERLVVTEDEPDRPSEHGSRREAQDDQRPPSRRRRSESDATFDVVV